jgi:hypothetical protein
MRTATTKIWCICACIGYLLCMLPQQSSAQYTNASDYPFIAGVEKFQYLTGGTLVSGIHQDDAAVTNIPIGFSFPFCGTNYTIGSVSSNGWFSLSTSTGTGLGVNNDNTNFAQFAGNNSLPVFMPLWDDLGYFIGSLPTPGASYITTGTAPNRVFTMEWKAWGWDFSPIPGSFTMQLKLYESGSFKFAYKRENGPVTSSQAVNTSANWFGASIGFAKTTGDYQFLNGSTRFSVPSSLPPFKLNIDSRPFSDQAYTWLAPCNGVQFAEIVAPDEDVCANTVFRMAAVTESQTISNTCVWYYSTDGATWNTMAATTGIITDAITRPTWYKANVTCGSQSYTTQPKLVNISGHYKCMCESASTILTSGTSSAMDIGNLDLINYTNNDTLIKNYEPSLGLTANIYSVKGYSDFTQEFGQIPTIYRDSLYRLNANVINWGQNTTDGIITAYIDYDHNGIFNSGERIIYGKSANVIPLAYAVNDTFRVSDTAKIGLTRMRVILRAGNTYPDSCGNYSEGETEDYLVRIDYPPCSGPAGAGKIEGEDTSMCAGYTYLLTDTTYEKTYSGLQRVWQNSADGVGWSDMPNTNNQDSIIRLFTGQPIYYRVKMTCMHTSDVTQSDTFHINVKPGYKCYCYSQAEGGLANDSSDIGAVRLSTLDINDGGTHLLNMKAHKTRTDRTDLTPLVLDVDSIYNFYIYHTMPREDHADAKITVFFDFNNNHQYDVPYERVFTGFTAIGYHTLINALIIPNNVIVNVPTGMRVILNNDVAPNIPSDEACGPYTSGETEDYIVMFKRPFPVGVKDANSMEHFSVFPNPTAGRATVQFNNDAVTDVSITVKDITGRQILQQSVAHPGGIFRHDIDLSAFAKGIYMVEVNAGNNNFVQKLSVQ